MRVAVIGSRNLTIENLQDYLPPETTEIISGGAKYVIGNCRQRGIPVKVFQNISDSGQK